MELNRASFTGLLAAGLALRLVLVVLAVPATHSAWFDPFLLAVPADWLDPWSGFLAAGGDPASFPYGAPYLLAFGPAVWLGGLIGGAYGAHLGLGLAALGFEALLVATLARLAAPAFRAAVLLFWLSPIALYVGYWHGQLDIFPVAVLAGALLAIAQGRHRLAGLLLGTAVAAKFSMAAALPFVLLYYLGRPRLRGDAPDLLAGLAAALAVLSLPQLLFSPGFRTMVLGTPETGKAFSLALDFAPGLAVYLLPLALLALLYWAWRVRRFDFGLLWTFTGLAFMALLLLTPAAPGWALWALPFVALHTARTGPIGQALYWPFALAFVALHLMISTGAAFAGADLAAPLAGLDPRWPSLLLTLVVAAGGALAVQMARRGVLASGFYRASRAPFALGVAGDSGTGKDTLVDSVVAMFGAPSVARLSGDDYHIWDRQKPMWRALTHLNPRANDLATFGAHVAELTDGRPVRTRHYDHASGRIGEPETLRPGEVIAVSGLHALWSPALATRYDVRVFMDMDEPLRRYLKLRRDVGERGHSADKVLATIARRAEDGARFIRPQAGAADIAFRLEPRHPSAISDPARPLDTTLLRLVVHLGPGRDFDRGARLLAALCGVQVIETVLADGRTQLLIEGEPTPEDIAAAARRLAPGMRAFLATAPVWRGGLSGIMQLIVLAEFDRARRERELAA